MTSQCEYVKVSGCLAVGFVTDYVLIIISETKNPPLNEVIVDNVKCKSELTFMNCEFFNHCVWQQSFPKRATMHGGTFFKNLDVMERNEIS